MFKKLAVSYVNQGRQLSGLQYFKVTASPEGLLGVVTLLIFCFSLGMDDPTLTLEQFECMPAVPREISSVRIREFDDSTANPEPIVQDDEADQLLEGFLSPSKLVRLRHF